MQQKPDAEAIRIFIKELESHDWIKRSERSVWPQFLFHYTDITNAIKILKNGFLYSREQLEYSKELVVSSGSSAVLAGTEPSIKDCVRLYFRPKTPTQYHAEGVRSTTTLQKSMYKDAHCPVPIFFLFDSASILTRADCFFSDGSLASPKARVFASAKELRELPWEKIYHNSSFDGDKQGDITFRRGAEVIVPKRLDLDSLRYIYCRSEAEQETLFSLLTPSLHKQYRKKIVSTTRRNLYFRSHTFLEKVVMGADAINLSFSPETRSNGPFHLDIDLIYGGQRKSYRVPNFNLTNFPSYKCRIPLGNFISSYSVEIHLDGFLIYANNFVHQEFEIPF